VYKLSAGDVALRQQWRAIDTPIVLLKFRDVHFAHIESRNEQETSGRMSGATGNAANGREKAEFIC